MILGGELVMFPDQSGNITVNETMGASEFKAKCLEILDQVASGALERVVITKRGRPVGVLTRPDPSPQAVSALHGFMLGSVLIPPGVDLTEPVAESLDAEAGILHR